MGTPHHSPPATPPPHSLTAIDASTDIKPAFVSFAVLPVMGTAVLGMASFASRLMVLFGQGRTRVGTSPARNLRYASERTPVKVLRRPEDDSI